MTDQQLGLTIPEEVIEALATAVSERLLPHLHTTDGTDLWPEWMAFETAARYLDVCPQRLRKQIAQRQIPFHQEDKGCRVLFRRSDLDQWMSTFLVPARASRNGHERA